MTRLRSVLGIAVAISLFGTACGSRLDDSQQATYDALLTARTSSGVESDETTQRPTSSDPSTGPEADSSQPGDSVSGTSPSDDGGSAPPDPGSDGPGPGVESGSCAEDSGSSEVGVSSERIVLGNVSLLSGAIPGFANTAVGGAKAFVDYVNATGGICGRQLELTVADDRFDSGANRSEHERLKDNVFAFVGSLSVVDDGGVSALRGTNIPDVTLGLSDARIALPNNFASTPFKPGSNSVGADRPARDLAQREGVTNFVLLWPAQATARNRALDYKADFERAGLTSAYEAEVSVTETNYTPHAAAICNADHEHMLLTTTLEVNGMSRLVKALRQQGCLPKVANVGTQAYGQQFIDLAGEAAEGVRIALLNDLVEGSTVPLTGTFAEWFARTNPSLQADFFAIQSWISTHMLVTAMRNANGDLTRDRVLQELRELTAYTAEGMIPPINPGEKIGPKCYVVATVQGGSWRRDFPAQGFRCP